MDGSISTPRTEGAIPRSGNKPLKKKWKFKKGKKSSRYQNVANKEWIHILIYIYIISYFFLFVKRNLKSKAGAWLQFAEVSDRNKKCTDLCGSDRFFRKALIRCQFSKSITNFPQLPTVWGEAITCRSSPTLRPDHFATALPHYCTNSLVRYRISTLIR